MNTRLEITDSLRVLSGVRYMASSLRQFKTVFVPPLIYDRWRNSYFINSSTRNNISYYHTHTASPLVNSRTVVCVCVCVFIKLHITAQPGPVKLIFQCYRNGSALWGISGVCMCVCIY